MPTRHERLVPIPLRAGEMLRIEGAEVGVRRGRVWVTLAGDAVDHFLDRGEAMHLPRGRHALVGAEGDALVVLDRATTLPGRLLALLQRLVSLRAAAGTPAPRARAARGT